MAAAVLKFQTQSSRLSLWFRLWLLALVWVNSAYSAPIAQADIEAFVRDGCPHCERAEVFLADLQRERPQLNIVIRNVSREPDAWQRLQTLAAAQNPPAPLRLPTFRVGGKLVIGYSAETGDLLLREALAETGPPAAAEEASGSCEVETVQTCEAGNAANPSAQPKPFELAVLGKRVALDRVGLPAFTVAMGLLDGFNPCSMWVLLLMISMLAPMRNRPRMLAVAGAFVLVEGVAYFVFMAAWLNLFLWIGLSRASEIAIAAIAVAAGALNLKDFWALGVGPSLSIPQAAKPDIYARIRRILQAENLWGALVGAVLLAVLVQIVELFCTSGFPALYTRILTLRQLQGWDYYGYLLLYNLAYMLDDIVVLALGIVTLSQQRLQRNHGRWLKLVSGAVMVGLGMYLFARGG
ncbi:NrdH-redoxin [Methylomonas sp. EFPC3]|uniref:glutaredoxin family protein n=1 Tax=Methylomonas sp. EFPC3 TaxID=3021710 RepID=UPI002417C316|nr:NrdH-redoxin [Methylomonas sp. EFPC3]WFP50887.1 NrdH-redoxin [Methylomonas sp. EFPC3]